MKDLRPPSPPHRTVHGTVVALHGTPVGPPGSGAARAGVLILGPSGSGKSDLALRLIDRGAILVADDQVLLMEQGGGIHAMAPPSLAGRLEIRGLGIVSMAHSAGVIVRLAVDLARPIVRLPDPAWWGHRDFPALSVPMMALAPFEASAPLKVERALARVCSHQSSRESWP